GIGGCNAAGGACSAAGQACRCNKDSDCVGGKCVGIPGDNDVACGAACTGSGPADAFDCQLGAPGIPSTPAVAFGYAPVSFTPGQYTPPASATTIDCSTTYDSSKHAFT